MLEPVGEGMTRGTAAGLIAILLGFGVFTWWLLGATSTPPQGAGAEPGTIAEDPGAVYDPVVAGEPLPRGFRQLLRRDDIAPVYEPAFRSAAETDWDPDTMIIGVAAGDEAKAYPVAFLNAREMVLDELGGEPILVSW